MNASETQTLTNNYVRAFYDGIIESRYKDDYEFLRWFSSSQARMDYAMNYRAIRNAIAGVRFSSCLELGPGPGTWTRVLYAAEPEARFDLVDISAAMHAQFKREMRDGNANVHYHVSDFMDYQPARAYDFFFSSRAFEYVTDKPGLLKKLHATLSPDAHGVLITKNPQFGLRKRREDRPIHSGQVRIGELKEMLEAAGFSDVRFRPAIIRVLANIPLLGWLSVYLSEKLSLRYFMTSLLGHHPWLMRTTESYLVTFTRK